MKNLQFTLTAAVMALGATAFAQSAAPQTPKAAANTFQILPAGKVIGLNVRGEPASNLGEIGDLLVDPRTGEIRYAVLEVGGFLGVGEDQRVVPWSLINVVCDEKDKDKCVARTSLTESRLKAAPKIKKDAKLDAELDKSVEAAFGKSEAWAFTGTGAPSFVRLSHAKGLSVTDGKGAAVGKLEDVILAPSNSCVAYLVVDTNKDAGDKQVALPWTRAQFQIDEHSQTLVSTPVEAAKFVNAPEYDAKDEKRMASTPWLTELCSYYGCDPFWKTARFANATRVKSERP